MDLIVTFLIFALILVALFYVTGLIPDVTLQKIARVIIVVGALLWLIGHIRPLIHAVAG